MIKVASKYNILLPAVIFLSLLGFQKLSFAQIDLSPTIDHDYQTMQELEEINENQENAIELIEFNESSENNNTILNINDASADELKKIFLLNEKQIKNLFEYLEKYGPLLTAYELQVIDGFDSLTIIEIISKISTAGNLGHKNLTFKQLIKHSRQKLFLRYGRTLEKQNGYLNLIDKDGHENNSKYLGGAEKMQLRYYFNGLNKIRFGFIAEKDQGEKLFNPATTMGVDFFTAHLGINDVGPLKSLVIGDYHLGFGQGLTIYTGSTLGKRNTGLNVKKYPHILKPNTSSVEYGFMRGFATTFDFRRFEITTFYSSQKKDATITGIDSATNEVTSVSNIIETGLHRTENETEAKNAIRERVIGGQVAFHGRLFDISAHIVHNWFSARILSNNKAYNRFTFSGKDNLVLGVSPQLLLYRMNFFSEISYSKTGGLAVLTGMISSISPRFDLAMIYRHYGKNYQNDYGMAFGENSKNMNEEGLYVGVMMHLHSKLHISAYADQFTFPWLKSQVNTPSRGKKYFVQARILPNTITNIFIRYKLDVKEKNAVGQNSFLIQLDKTWRHSIRIHCDYTMSNTITIRSRVEMITNKQEVSNPQHGFLLYQDFIYKPENKSYKFYIRYALFDTDSFDERIYAYENDVLYALSVPAYYYRGSRVYLLIHYTLLQKIDFWIKIGQTVYKDRESIGTGPSEIMKNVKTDILSQIRFKL